jgi:hypothetical protein
METLRKVARVARDGLMALAREGLRLLALQLTLLLAVILVFEEWGWRPLAALLSELARFRPWGRLEAWIAGLPPYAALIAFGLPTTLLLPVKLAAFYFLALGQPFAASAIFVAAKVVGTALVARIFLLTKPSLMQLAWFARLYHWFVPWKDALVEQVRATWAWRAGHLMKSKVLREMHRLWHSLKPRLREVWLRLKDATAAWRIIARLWMLRHWRRLCTILGT